MSCVAYYISVKIEGFVVLDLRYKLDVIVGRTAIVRSDKKIRIVWKMIFVCSS